jgi:arabinofuranosyltransferase
MSNVSLSDPEPDTKPPETPVKPKKDRTQDICLLIFLVYIIAFAFVCDDAYHSMRMSVNLVNGDGLVYNVGERVSASTSPLLPLLTAIFYKLTGQIYLSALLVNIISSIAAVIIIFRSFCRTRSATILATIIMLASKAFISFTTSGLENSLLFCLFAILISLFYRYEPGDHRRLLAMFFCVGLIAFTRMDTVLMTLPLLLYLFFKRRPVRFFTFVFLFLVGMLPFIIWECFSLVYYGVPFPNTAYAKLGTDIPLQDYLTRGLEYYGISFLHDPIIIFLPLAFILLAWQSKITAQRLMSAGILLYLMYIIYIGGDFMAGRFFTVPFLIALCGLLELSVFADMVEYVKGKAHLICNDGLILTLFCLVLLCFTSIISSVMQTSLTNFYKSAVDERAFYFGETSLVAALYWAAYDDSQADVSTIFSEQNYSELWQMQNKTDYKGILLQFASGRLVLYFAGDYYVNDRIALGDPFLVHMPVAYTTSWRIGHMRRIVPEGYAETLLTGENKLKDPNLAAYLDILWEITRSEELFSARRFSLILNFNLGRYDYLLADVFANMRE